MMAALLADMKAPGLRMTLAAALLLCGCTTTTTLTTADDSGTRSRARAASPTARSAPIPAYVVQSGDTLYSIAFRQRVDLRELIAWNGLAEPYTIYPGQRLRIGNAPERRSTDAHAPPSRPSVAKDSPRVAAGRPDEPPMSEVPARAPTRTEPPIAAPTAHTDPAPPPPVSSMPAIPIAVDGGVREAVVDDAQPAAPNPPGTASNPSSMPVAVSATPAPTLPPPWPETPAEPTREMLAVRSAPTRTVGGIGWQWPNGAALVGRFAADDEARQGIRLQAPAGTPVSASADGEVVYSGNGLVGLGELVIIKHGADYLSAYGLNRKRLVTEGQKVRAGQHVAEMGNSAGVVGLLHFEVRRGGRPIDPLSVLPSR